MKAPTAADYAALDRVVEYIASEQLRGGTARTRILEVVRERGLGVDWRALVKLGFHKQYGYDGQVWHDSQFVARSLNENEAPTHSRWVSQAEKIEPSDARELASFSMSAEEREAEEAERRMDPGGRRLSDVRDPKTDPQPAPKPGDGPSMHDLAIEFLEARKRFGLEKYGTLLQAGNGRDNLQDAIDEVADLLVYLFAEREERHRERSDREVTLRFINDTAAREFAANVARHKRVRTPGIEASCEVVH